MGSGHGFSGGKRAMSEFISRQKLLRAFAALVAGLTLMTTAQAQNYQAIVALPDRTDADRQTDKRRDPVNLLVFTAAKAG